MFTLSHRQSRSFPNSLNVNHITISWDPMVPDRLTTKVYRNNSLGSLIDMTPSQDIMLTIVALRNAFNLVCSEVSTITAHDMREAAIIYMDRVSRFIIIAEKTAIRLGVFANPE